MLAKAREQRNQRNAKKKEDDNNGVNGLSVHGAVVPQVLMNVSVNKR